MDQGNAIEVAFAEFGDRMGATRRYRRTLYRPSDETIAVTHLEKSLYGPTYFLEQGFWIRALGDDAVYPRLADCHVSARVDELFPEHEESLEALLSFDMSPLPDGLRQRGVLDFLVQYIGPVITRGATLCGLRDMRHEGLLDDAFILQAARPLL